MIKGNKIALIGCGNVATNMGIALQQKGYSISIVYGHTKKNAQELSALLKCKWTTTPQEIKDADIYLTALKDSVAREVWQQINFDNKLVLHTAGSLPANVLQPYTNNYGVIYPLMTLSQKRILDFTTIPLFIEANTPENLEKTRHIAHSISNIVQETDSETRGKIHLAAVWANNFTNYAYAVAGEILKKENIPFNTLLPLIDETARKVHDMTPIEAQTGPAIRMDQNIIKKHLSIMEDKEAELYKKISEGIHLLMQKKS